MNTAQWIWENDNGQSDEYVDFYDSFECVSGKNVKISVSVAGDYALYVNGKFVTCGQYADYGHYKVYDEISLEKFVRCGKNEIKITAWYIGKSCFTYKDFGCGLAYEIKDGEKTIAFSGRNTVCQINPNYVSHKNKYITAQLGLSYEYDFCKKAGSLKTAVQTAGFSGETVKRPDKKIIVPEARNAVLIDAAQKIYDLGKESCGYLHVKFKSLRGEKIKVVYGEHLADGKVRDEIDGRDFSVSFIGSGNVDEFTGYFRRLGCRYLQVYGNAEIESIGLAKTEYPFTVLPYTIKDDLERKIYEVSVETLKLCYHGHYEDCPWREQSMYIMDTRNQMRCGYYAFDNIETATSSIRLMAQGQKENGLFDLCFPADSSITIPSFSLAFISVVKEYTEKVKDTSLLGEVYVNIEKTLGYFISRIDKNGLFKTVNEEGIWHFYEWAGDLDGAFFSLDGAAKNRNCYDVLINAFLSIAFDEAALLSSLLFNYEKMYYYKDLQKKLNGAIRKMFYSEETGLYKTYAEKEEYSALANALCILADVADDNQKKRIAEKLSSDYGGWVQNTISMNLYKYDALLKTDEKYAAYIISDIKKVYGYMLDKGATSFWETINGEADFANAGSLCHGWSALPIYYFRIFGICGKKEPAINGAFSLRDAPCRSEYLASVEAYTERLSSEATKERDAYLYLPEEEKRAEFKKLIGADVTKFKHIKLISCEKVIENERYISTRYTFLLDGIVKLSGLMYENKTRREKEKLVINLHGGGGTPEILGGLFIESANYNKMVERSLKAGIKVFAPQLLLWNTDVYGTPYDRGRINRRLIQLGSSITALELNALSAVVDYFENDSNTDISTLGVVGLSYGGMYALHFGAYDQRVKYTYSSCWFSNRKKHNWHDWTYFNAERKFFDAEVASLVFPRKLYIEVAERDEVFPAGDCETEKKRLEEYARKTGNENNLHFKVFNGTHELDKDDNLLQEFIRRLTSGV